MSNLKTNTAKKAVTTNIEVSKAVQNQVATFATNLVAIETDKTALVINMVESVNKKNVAEIIEGFRNSDDFSTNSMRRLRSDLTGILAHYAHLKDSDKHLIIGFIKNHQLKQVLPLAKGRKILVDDKVLKDDKLISANAGGTKEGILDSKGKFQYVKDEDSTPKTAYTRVESTILQGLFDAINGDKPTVASIKKALLPMVDVEPRRVEHEKALSEAKKNVKIINGKIGKLEELKNEVSETMQKGIDAEISTLQAELATLKEKVGDESKKK